MACTFAEFKETCEALEAEGFLTDTTEMFIDPSDMTLNFDDGNEVKCLELDMEMGTAEEEEA